MSCRYGWKIRNRESLARTEVTVDIASEFRYRDPIVTPEDLVIVISQSGETADTKAALQLSTREEVPRY